MKMPVHRRRPTVPFGPWRIALDLEGTRAIAAAPALARGCRCAWCRNWAAAWNRVLPPDVASALRRLGIDPADPTDLYATRPFTTDRKAADRTPATTQYSVFYHCVGVVRDGPALYRSDAVLETDRLHQFYPLRSGPTRLDVSVAPQRLVYHFPFKPPLREPIPGLIEVCFWTDVPWLLDEEHPHVAEARNRPREPVVWAGGRLRPARQRRARSAPNPF
ncbi:MAG TPA: hypothetical protein VF665_03920 [Longimicrobium sp.]|jgi:hypothetical protein|uniref:hypothetical protein n=1 Tax=Longimicrobium sp. TaxID=2029185 RepID=UPI002EDAF9CA